jgi:hypothetical protein
MTRNQLLGNWIMRVVIVTLLVLAGIESTAAQVIESSGFYQQVYDYHDKDGKRHVEPSRGILARELTLAQLPKFEGRPTVYVSVKLTEGQAAQRIYFLFKRVYSPDAPDCPAEKDQIVNPKELNDLVPQSLTREGIAYAELVRRAAADISPDLAVGNVKVLSVSLSPDERTAYDWRHVDCPGRVQVFIANKEKALISPKEFNGLTLDISK